MEVPFGQLPPLLHVAETRVGSDLSARGHITASARYSRVYAFSNIEVLAIRIGSPAPFAVVARKQRWFCVEPRNVVATDAVAARVTAVIIARRKAPICVRIAIAIVVVVVPGRRGGGDCGCPQSVPGIRTSVVSTRKPNTAGRRSIAARLDCLDPKRDAAPVRPAERQQRHTRDGRGCDRSSFQSYLHGFSRSHYAPHKRCARDRAVSVNLDGMNLAFWCAIGTCRS